MGKKKVSEKLFITMEWIIKVNLKMERKHETLKLLSMDLMFFKDSFKMKKSMVKVT